MTDVGWNPDKIISVYATFVLWFRAKTYGWGWTPGSWQGWLCVGVYVILMTVTPLVIEKFVRSPSDTLLGTFPFWIVYTIALITISYLTGEKPRWRWGK